MDEAKFERAARQMGANGATKRFAKEVVQRALARQAAKKTSAEPTFRAGRFGQAENGRPIHYAPTASGIVDSEVAAYDLGTIRLTEEEHLTRTFSIHCQAEDCGVGVHNRAEWKAHNAEAHDGNAMWANTPNPNLFIGGYRDGGRRADGDILLTSVDGDGKTIRCRTEAQARREAERHGLQIKQGPGER